MAFACCGKVILIVLNLAFMVVGLALTIVGAMLAFIPGTILKTLYETAKDAAKAGNYNLPQSANDIANLPMIHEIGLALFVLGVILTILSFMGCCGSCSTCCKCLLIGFALVMIALMIGEIVVGSLFLTKDSTLHDNIRSKLKEELKHYNETDSNDAFSQTMNMIQIYFDCCGVDNATDYTIKPYTCESNIVGCYKKLTNIIEDNLLYAGLVLGGILLLQLIEIIFAIIIFKDNKILPV